MAHYMTMFDRDFIGAFDLDGKDAIVTIASVTAGQLTAPGGKKNKKPVVKFEGKEKGLALNKTNCKTLAGLYGTDTDAWVGKRITIYPTTTTFGSEEVHCIRIRPTAPNGKGK